MIKSFLAVACLLMTLSASHVAGQDEKIVNGEFKAGLKGWRITGDVHLQMNRLGKVCACIGPGGGSLAQPVHSFRHYPIATYERLDFDASLPRQAWPRDHEGGFSE
jgi:hypothetical protein